ncbi:type II toxin-antitoxin system HicB family antitoxin [Paenibacillus sp. alder61]|uniref:type II toxin-antitoxin system HicB family antitoxin n=1 Tax=Paenibacillus sp. alder61 TaxID=2862948 RepID=UPI000F91C27A|nr:type II toxin-antitoxin system HicB family antitoxin [Paenibacillus sp. alder61]MCA1291738.1 type II toxin-antitoxin system HicB family antitoxin [Paenibacillus sp. alder61]
MVQKEYEYWAIFHFADDGISVSFPDLPGCISCGYSTEEAIQMAKEALMLYLEDMTEETIPKPTQISTSTLTPSEKVYLIKVKL